MAELADIVAVLEGIRTDLGTTAATSAGVSGPDMQAHTDALQANTEAMDELGSQTEQTRTSMREMDESARDATGTLGKLSQRMKDVSGSMFSMQGSINMMVDGLIKIGKGLLDVAKNSLKATNELNQLTTGMMATTGASDKLVKAIGAVYDRTLMLGVTLENAKDGVDALMHSMSDFTRLAPEHQEALTTDAVILEQIGVSFEAFSAIMETGTKTLGMSWGEASNQVYKLRGAARDLQLPLDTMMRQMPQLTDKLSDMGDQTFKAAIAIMKLVKETGVASDSITSLDDQMYTFEGATKFAAGMNQALQGSFFNPHELMQAYDESPEAAFKLIRQTLDEAGKTLDDMGRREQRFMANRMNISISEFRKMLGNEMGTLDSEMGKTATDRAAAEADAGYRMKSQVDSMRNFKKAFEEMPVAAVEEKIRKIQNHLGPAALDTAQMARDFLIVGAEARSVEGALAATAANAATVASEGPSGEIGAGITGLISGAVATTVNLLPKIWPALKTALSGLWGNVTGWFGRMVLNWQITAFSQGTMAAARQLIAPILRAAFVIAGLVNSAIETYKNITSVIKSGGDYADQFVATLVSISYGFGELFDYVTSGFGILDEGLFSQFTRIWNPGGKSFAEAYLNIDWSYMSEPFGFMMSDFGEQMEALAFMLGYWFEQPIIWIKEQWGSMVDWLATSFEGLGPRIEAIGQDMYMSLPAPIRYVIKHADELGESANKTINAGIRDWDNMIEAISGTGRHAQQNITVVSKLNDREVEKTVLNVVGGVVQPVVV